LQPGHVLRFGAILFRLVSDKIQETPVDDNSDRSTQFIHSKPAYYPPSVEQLSVAQLRVLDLLLAGHAEKGVASNLEISPHTVHNHVKEIYRKMGVSSRPELLSLFVPDSKKPDVPEK
jgi:DNA-binding NarL/FixJ family response regulator